VEEDLSLGGEYRDRRERTERQNLREKKKGTGAAGGFPELEPSLLLQVAPWHALSLALEISSSRSRSQG